MRWSDLTKREQAHIIDGLEGEVAREKGERIKCFILDGNADKLERDYAMLHPTHERKQAETLLTDARFEGAIAGYFAWSEGDYSTTNPYRKGSVEWQEWWLGYDTKDEL